jgi:hypothetical protein
VHVVSVVFIRLIGPGRADPGSPLRARHVELRTWTDAVGPGPAEQWPGPDPCRAGPGRPSGHQGQALPMDSVLTGENHKIKIQDHCANSDPLGSIVRLSLNWQRARARVIFPCKEWSILTNPKQIFTLDTRPVTGPSMKVV